MNNQGFKIIMFANGVMMGEVFLVGMKENERERAEDEKERQIEELAKMGVNAFGFIYYVPWAESEDDLYCELHCEHVGFCDQDCEHNH